MIDGTPPGWKKDNPPDGSNANAARSRHTQPPHSAAHPIAGSHRWASANRVAVPVILPSPEASGEGGHPHPALGLPPPEAPHLRLEALLPETALSLPVTRPAVLLEPHLEPHCHRVPARARRDRQGSFDRKNFRWVQRGLYRGLLRGLFEYGLHPPAGNLPIRFPGQGD